MNISTSTNGRWRASGKPLLHLITGKAYCTSRSKRGSIPGTARANARPLDDRRNEDRLVAGGYRRPGFAACLYCGRQSCCRPQAIAFRICESFPLLGFVPICLLMRLPGNRIENKAESKWVRSPCVPNRPRPERVIEIGCSSICDSPAAARRTVQNIVDSIEQLLSDNPPIGRAGRVPGTRELAKLGPVAASVNRPGADFRPRPQTRNPTAKGNWGLCKNLRVYHEQRRRGDADTVAASPAWAAPTQPLFNGCAEFDVGVGKARVCSP